MTTALTCDDDVKAVAEFMQANVAATKLIPVAEAMFALAPILWGRYGRDELSPVSLEAIAEQQTPTAAKGSA